MTEEELIRKCQRGDSRSQEEVYIRYADAMFRLALRYVKTNAEAEDTVIKGFTKVFKSINAFKWQGAGSLEGWIRRIVINEALMFLRKDHNFNLTESIEHGLAEPDLADVAGLGASDILRLINDLPTGYRAVFSLNVIDGYDHHEISKMLNIAESTSRSQLFKAKTLLKKMLTKEGYHYGT